MFFLISTTVLLSIPLTLVLISILKTISTNCVLPVDIEDFSIYHLRWEYMGGEAVTVKILKYIAYIDLTLHSVVPPLGNSNIQYIPTDINNELYSI